MFSFHLSLPFDVLFRQNQFLAISSAANCTNDLACLRNTSTSVLRTLNNEFLSAGLQPGHPSAYEPCMEGKGGYLTRNTAELLVEGKVAGVSSFPFFLSLPLSSVIDFLPPF
jgi:hypothetical protein